MKSIILYFILCINPTQSCQHKEIEPIDSISVTLQQQTALMEKHYVAANFDSLLTIFDTNCIVSIPKNSVLKSKAEVLDFYTQSSESRKKYRSFKLTPTEYRSSGDIIFEIGTCKERYAVPPLKRLYIERHNYQIIWKETKSGEYLIQSIIWNEAEAPTN